MPTARVALDAGLVGGLLLLALAPVLAPGVEVQVGRPAGGRDVPDAWSAALATALVAPLLVRHRAPATVTVWISAVLALGVALGVPATAADLALPVAVYGLVRRAGSRCWWAGAASIAPPATMAVVAGAGPAQALGWWSVLVPPAAVAAVAVETAARSGPARDDPDATPGSGVVAAEGRQAAGAPVPVAADGAVARLTARELEVLDLVAGGLSNAEAAATLGLSPETVKTYLRRARLKLGARDRTAAVVRVAGGGRPPRPGPVRGAP